MAVFWPGIGGRRWVFLSCQNAYGATGGWLFKTPYTLAEQQGFLGFLPYILLGKLTSPPGQHEQIVGLFHLFRISGGILVCLAAYDFASIFVSEIRWRRIATVIAMIGGGLGVLSILGFLGCGKGRCRLSFIHPKHLVFWDFWRYRIWPGRARYYCGDWFSI